MLGTPVHRDRAAVAVSGVRDGDGAPRGDLHGALYVLLDLRQFDAPYAAVLSQAIGNGFLGVVGAQMVELLPGLRERRRARRVGRH